MTGWNLRTVAAILAGAAAGGLMISGCAKHTARINTQSPSQSTLSMDDTAQRLADLQKTTDQLSADSQGLPGKSPAEHRDTMKAVLADYGKVLPLLAGPRAGLIFHEQVMTLDAARQQLAAESPDLSAEPAIDNGLRSTERALADLATAEVFASAQLSSTFDDLNAKLNELDNVHGPLHEVVVGEAVQKANTIIDQMAQILIARLTPPAPPAASEPATAPATEPATEAATEPAATPTTAPATEPAMPPTSAPANPSTMPMSK